VIGSELSNTAYAIPNLIGLTLAQARALLKEKGIELASIIPDPGVRDTVNAYVYRQSPDRFDDEGHIISIRAGQVMDVWVSATAPVVDSLSGHSPSPADSIDNE